MADIGPPPAVDDLDPYNPPPFSPPPPNTSPPPPVPSTSPSPALLKSYSSSPDLRSSQRPASMPAYAFSGVSMSGQGNNKLAVATCSYTGAPPGHLTFYMNDTLITQYRVRFTIVSSTKLTYK